MATLVAPRFQTYFNQPLLSAALPGGSQAVLVLNNGSGALARDVLERIGGGRVVAVDDDDGMLEYARRISSGGGGRVFYKREHASSLSFGDEVFDLALGVFGDEDETFDSLEPMLREVRRVTRPGARMVASFPAAKSTVELAEMLAEVARAERDDALLARIEALAGKRQYQWMQASKAAGFAKCELHTESFHLSFSAAWQIGDDPLTQATLWPRLVTLAHEDPDKGEERVRDAVARLGTYSGQQPLSITVEMVVATLRR